MGLFSKDNRTTSKHGATTIIAEGTTAAGELILTGNIQVDGKVIGKVQTEKMVTISPSGNVEGAIYADKAIINGYFEGEIFAKNVEILSKGKLQGEITSTELIIHKGGVFLGNSKTVTSEEVVSISEKKENIKATAKPQPKQKAV